MEAKILTLTCSDGKSVNVPPKCIAMCTLLTSLAEDFSKASIPLEFSSNVMQAFVDALSVKDYSALISPSLYFVSDYFGLSNLRKLLIQRRDTLIAAKCRAFFSEHKDMLIEMYEKKGDDIMINGLRVKYLHVDLQVIDFAWDELFHKVKISLAPDESFRFSYLLGIRNREQINEIYQANVNIESINKDIVRLRIKLRTVTCSKITLDNGRIFCSM